MAHYLGIDIGATNTKVGIVSHDGEIVELRRLYTTNAEPTPEQFLEQIISVLESLIDHPAGPIRAIGICCPGFQMDDGQGIEFSVNLPFLNGVDIRDVFEKRFALRVLVLNDLVGQGLAEAAFGVGKGVDRFLSISLGTGVGHTYIHRGKPVLSLGGISGDSGRMIIDPSSTMKDLADVNGSVEALCGVNAIETLGKNTFKNHYTAQEIISMARERGDPQAVEIMCTIGRRLAVYLFDLSVIYFPEMIALAGGQTEAGPFFIDEVQREYDRLGRAYFAGMRHYLRKELKARIVKANAGGLAGVVGSIVPYLF
jgi:glucokinase